MCPSFYFDLTVIDHLPSCLCILVTIIITQYILKFVTYYIIGKEDENIISVIILVRRSF